MNADEFLERDPRHLSRRQFLRGSVDSPDVDTSGAVQSPRAAPGRGPDSVRVDGTWHDAEVPDTLDLAHRGALALNVLTRNVEPDNGYSVYQMFRFEKPAVPPRKVGPMHWNITGKNLRSLPWMRTMCGSVEALDTEYQMMQALSSAIDGGGFVRYTPEGGALGAISYPTVNALLLLAIDNWRARDGSAEWKERMSLLAGGLQRSAIQVEDRAYFPLECAIDEKGEWRVTRTASLLPYKPPAEPIYDQQGPEGSARFFHAAQIGGLIQHYRQSGDRQALELSTKLARSILKPSMWVDLTPEGIAGHEHGIWEGHVHGNIYALHMLASLAEATGDQAMMRLVKEGYHHAHRIGVAATGYFPGWTYPLPGSAWGKGRRPEIHNAKTEGCAVSDMLILAVKLSDLGMGDYWDDVDHIIRNQLAEQQYTSLDLMRAAAGGDASLDPMLSRFIGGFGSARPTYNMWIAGCCTANCTMGLYYAWHGITRFQDGIATVNLFLNRASTWMDVDSYLPYEGKVVLRNKGAHTAMVRVPAWLRGHRISARIGSRSVQPRQAGSFLMFEGLKAGDEVTLTFPVPQTTQEYTLSSVKYQLVFRGSTVVDVSPRVEDPKMYPIFKRDHMKANKAPMLNVKRFVPHRVLPLQ